MRRDDKLVKKRDALLNHLHRLGHGLLQHIPKETIAIVLTGPLDDYAEQSGVLPDAVKIDVEGSESEVIDGAAGILRAKRPVVLLSIHDRADIAGLIGEFARLGYHVSRIEGAQGPEVASVLATPQMIPNRVGWTARHTMLF